MQRLDLPVFRFDVWSNVRWGQEDKPLLIVDGKKYRLRELKDEICGADAYIVGMKEKDWSKVLMLKINSLHFYEMQIDNITPLADMPFLKNLKIHSNTKLSDIRPLQKLAELETLILEDTPKVNDLSPLATMHNLRAFKCAGGVNSKNKVETLEPLCSLSSLEELELSNLKVERLGILPLANCRVLKHLYLSNEFDTEEYAYLSKRLLGTKCDKFAPWTKVQPIGDKDIMVTGKRKPFLNSETQKDKIRHFEDDFKKLQEKY